MHVRSGTLVAVVALALAALLPLSTPARAASDTTPPVISEFDMWPDHVDTTDADAVVHFRVRVTDDLSGVSSAGAGLVSLDRSQSIGTFGFRLVSGDQHDGVYEGSVTIPQYSATGTWIVDRVFASDGTHNNSSENPYTLRNAGSPYRFSNVASSGDIEPDTSAPGLGSLLAVSPGSVDVRQGAATVTIEAETHDNQSRTKLVRLGLRSPAGQDVMSDAQVLVDYEHMGTWRATVTVPQGAASGEWLVRVIAEDHDGNVRDVLYRDLYPQYGDSAVDVVTVTGAANSTEPGSTEPVEEEAGAPAATPNLDHACRSGDVPSAGFSDVPTSNPHRMTIDCAVSNRVAGGYADGTYRPGNAVTRAQMATFIVGLFEAAGQPLPDSGDRYADVPASHAHRDSINRLGAAIPFACGDGRFCPDATVSRAQMATFMSKVLTAMGIELTAEHAGFTDVAGNVHETYIRRAAGAGIAGGYSADTYGPSDSVTRAQMATFMMRTLDIALQSGPS